ncbi:MAG: metal ABC transporter substrate-binding protein [Planctomycetota bacterium]|nr:metal ABC transporter substrate-binding protein [Planctomycetota bacterium]MDA0933790.1 metal ABC transporter substrate-binding protein [Planctomycetota bacterium]
MRYAHSLLSVLALATTSLPAQTALSVCATTPNLGALIRTVGEGTPIEVKVFARATQDPHFVRALPSFIKELSQADLFVLVGLELESGWVPALLDQARNADVLPGGRGYFDASTAIRPLGVPNVDVDRTFGDIHARGNPHYLVDPVSGSMVADALADRMGQLLPAHRERFRANAAALRSELGAMLVGEELAAAYDFRKLAQLRAAGRLRAFLEAQEQGDALGGFYGAIPEGEDLPVLADHDAWRYVAATMGLRTIGFLEPRPGIPPTTAHLRSLVDLAAAEKPKALLHAPYFEARAIAFVVEATGVSPVELAHQVGALPGTEDYVALVRTNLGRIVACLTSG